MNKNELIKSVEKLLTENRGIEIPIIPYYMMLADYKFIQVRFPKSKKHRIRKKFNKKNQNYKYVEQPKIIVAYGRIYANRLAYDLLKKTFAACGCKG